MNATQPTTWIPRGTRVRILTESSQFFDRVGVVAELIEGGMIAVQFPGREGTVAFEQSEVRRAI